MFKLLTKLILGTSLLAAFFPPGVPSVAPFPVSGTKVDGYVPTVQADLTVAWEAQAGGGSGLTVTGTPIYGETVGFNDFDDTWVPQKPGAGVFPVKAYGASGRSDISTTGTVSSSSTALTLAAATTFAKGNYIAIVGAGATHGIAAPSKPVIVGGGAVAFTVNATSNITTLGSTKVVSVAEPVNASSTTTLPAGLSATTYYWCWADTWTTNATSNIITLGSSQAGLAAGEGLKPETTNTLPSGTSAGTFVYWTYADVVTVNTGSDVVTTTISQPGIANGDPVRFEATTSTPTGLTANTVYYARVASPTTFTIYDTSAHAIAGGATGLVDISTSGSGTIYMVGPDLSANTIGQFHNSSVNALANTNRVDLTDTGTGTHYVVGSDLTGTTLGQLFPTSGDVTSNTNRVDITGTGTGTHYLNGGTTTERGAGSFSGDGGWSAVSTTTQCLTSWANLDANNWDYVCFRAVSNSDGFYITGRSSTQANRSVIARVNGAANAKMVTFQASGYTNAVQSDIGKTVTCGGSTGVLAGYDNTNRFWWIIPTVFGTDTFAFFGSATIGSGTGAGTSTAVEDAYSWKDTGDASVIATTSAGVAGATQPSLARRASTVYYPGEIIVHPIGPTGQTYLCTRVEPQLGNYPTSSSTATGSLSLGTTIGTEYQDGDIFWMAVNLAMPVDEPTAAVPNLLRTQISAISGTSVTLASAAGNSVTSQTVLHDEWSAINAARTAAIAANAASTVLYFDDGLYFCILGEPDANTWSQWNAVSGGDIAWSFTVAGQRIRWQGAESAKFVILPTSHRANTADTGDIDTIFAGNGGQFSYSLNTIFAPMCEPKLIQQDGWNRTFFYGDYSTGATQRVSRTLVENCDIYGFCRIWSSGISTGYGHGSIVQNCRMSWGGAGHDALLYGSFNRILNNTFYGHETFGSDVLYTDDESTDTINDLLVFSGNKIFKSRVNGLRLRVSKNIVTNNHWMDTKTSSDIILCDSLASGVLANNTATNGGIFRMTGVNWSIANNTLRNAQIYLQGGTSMSATGGSIYFDTNASDYFQGGEACLQVSGGTDVIINGMSINNAETSGPAAGVIVSSTGRTSLNGVHVYASSDLGINVTSAMSGRVLINGGYYRSGSGPQGHYLTQNASGTVVAQGATFDSSSASNTIYSTAGGLRLHDCTLLCALEIGPHVCELVDNTVSGGTASIISCFTSLKADGNEWATSPTDNTPSKTFATKNRIAASMTSSPSALASGSTNDYALSIADNQRLDPNASNSTLTGIVACADGTEKTITNVDAGAATVILDEGATASTDANEFTFVGGDLTIPAGQSATIKYDGTSAKWRLKSKTF